MRAPAAFVVHDSHRDSDKTADEAPQSNISEQTRSDEAANGHGVAIVKEDLESSMTEKHEKRGENEVPEDPQVPLPGAEKAGPQELRTWRVMLMIGASWLGVFLTALDSTVMATILGPISTSFSSFTTASWLATAFFIATAATQPISGRLTDLYGRRAGLVLSNATFATGNLICGLARSESILLFGRVVAGLGGGGIYAIATFMGSDLIPLRQRGIALGLNNILYGVGLSLGGFLGGWITDAIGWKWVFLLQVPLAACTTVLVFFVVHIPCQLASEDQKRIDFLGSFLLVTGLVSMLVGLNAGGNFVQWKNPLVVSTIPLGFLLLGGFAWWETRADAPIIPVSVFVRQRTVLASCSSYLLTHMAFFASLYYIPFYLQALGYTSLQVGLRLISLSCGLAAGAVVAGIVTRMTGRYVHINLAAHMILVLAFSLYTTLGLNSLAWHVFIFLAIGGFGFGLTLVINLVALVSAVDQKHAATVTAMAFLFRSVGSTLGIAFVSVAFQNTFRSRLGTDLQTYDVSAREALIKEIVENVSNIEHLPPTTRSIVKVANIKSLHVVFLVMLGFTLAGVVAGAFIKQNVLHNRIDRRRSSVPFAT